MEAARKNRKARGEAWKHAPPSASAPDEPAREKAREARNAAAEPPQTKSAPTHGAPRLARMNSTKRLARRRGGIVRRAATGFGTRRPVLFAPEGSLVTTSEERRTEPLSQLGQKISATRSETAVWFKVARLIVIKTERLSTGWTLCSLL